MLVGFIGFIIILLVILFPAKAWPAETVDDRLSRLEKQVEIQQREIIFLYAQINYPVSGQIIEPRELKDAIKKYRKRK